MKYLKTYQDTLQEKINFIVGDYAKHVTYNKMAGKFGHQNEAKKETLIGEIIEVENDTDKYNSGFKSDFVTFVPKFFYFDEQDVKKYNI